MLQSDLNAAVAEALLQARRTRRPCDAAPLAGHLKTADDAYRVQAVVAGQGPFPGYWKSGGPSRRRRPHGCASTWSWNSTPAGATTSAP
jgi:hypothetical protein